MSIMMTQVDTIALYNKIGEISGAAIEPFMISTWALDLEAKGLITVRELDSLVIHRAAICAVLADDAEHEEAEAMYLSHADKSMSNYWSGLDL